MRIIAGEFRGRKLKRPSGKSTRPTKDRVREAVFNMIAKKVPDQAFLTYLPEAVRTGLRPFRAVRKERCSLKGIWIQLRLLSLILIN